MNLSTSNSNAELKPEDRFQFPWALLIVILMVVVIELFAYAKIEHTMLSDHFYAHAKTPTLSQTVVQAKVEFILDESSQVDLLIVGDSSGLMGIDANLLERKTGLQTYNLGTTALLGIEGNLYLLEQYIEKHAAPKIVLFHTAPEAWGYSQASINKWDWQSWVKPQLQNIIEPVRIKKRTLPSKYFAHVAQEMVLTTSFRNRLLSTKREDYLPHLEMRTLLEDQKGSMNEVHDKVKMLNHPPALPSRYSIVQDTAFKKLLALSEKKGFQLYIACNPIPEIYRTPRNVDILNEMEQKITDVVSQKKHVKIKQPLMYFIPSKNCYTLNHLAPEYKPEYTNQLAQWVNSLNSAKN